MKIKVLVPTPNDNHDEYYKTSMLVRFIPPLNRVRRRNTVNHLGEYELKVSSTHMSKSDDPIIENIRQAMRTWFFPRTRLNRFSILYNDDNQNVIMSRKMDGGMFTLHLLFNGSSVRINGISVSKENAEKVVSKIINRLCFESSCERMKEYTNMLLTVPPRVVHALENRTPYRYFRDGERIKVRLNTKRISEKECALEISDSVWIPIKNKDLDSFIKYHKESNNRSKKWNLSPMNLIRTLDIETYKNMSTSAEKVMHHFLDQNRTQKLVEERAQKLLTEMEEKFPTKLKVFMHKDSEDDNEPRKSMIVNGKLADWVIMPQRRVHNVHQSVEVYAVGGQGPNREHTVALGQYDLKGPICIDNVHSNSSIGDQIVSRALALLNDHVAVQAIHTLKGYIPPKVIRVDKEWIDRCNNEISEQNEMH